MSIVLSSKPLGLVGRKHPALSTPATDVIACEEVAQLSSRLLSTCRVHHGLAIAACQIGEPINLIVTFSGHVYLNSRVEGTGEQIIELEECLSLPGKAFEVPRYQEATLTAMGLEGNIVEQPYDGLLARMWQHEQDHLNGHLISETWPQVYIRS